jgi:hypothetical protein
MGFEDIAYDLIKEYHAAKTDKKRRLAIAKILAKKAYLRFNFEWVSERDSDRLDGRFDGQKWILEQYSKMFLDLAVEIYDILPEESNRMKSVATWMKKGAYSILTHSSNEITPTGDNCASLVMEYVKNITE